MPNSSSRCRSCDAPITWGVNVESGKGIPLDPEPVDDGNLIEVSADAGNASQIPVRHINRGDEVDPIATRYQSHFSTCPDADDWRSKSTARGNGRGGGKSRENDRRTREYAR